ncbi:MAG TPA: polyhydroxyalkanoic acid system family protein [Thermoanaerobaculia bacterium]|nr:polyhydroxyalkanoic acid system family protein [Thermoanaerobaculia bacterium]
MRIAVPHNTTKDVARAKLDQRLGSLLSQFGHQAEEMEHEWIGDTLRFKGKARGLKVEGTVEVTDAAVIIDGKLPLIAMPFESRIREAVQREADAMFRMA